MNIQRGLSKKDWGLKPNILKDLYIRNIDRIDSGVMADRRNEKTEAEAQ